MNDRTAETQSRSNGHAVASPQIVLTWNTETQLVEVEFDNEQFKTFDFVIAVLEMARAAVDQSRRVALAAEMRQQAQAQQQHAMLLDQVTGRGPI